ncbi:MAG: AraC family transcriptional regulator [Saccharofermentanales bacterium]
MIGEAFEFAYSNRIEKYCSRLLDVDLDLYYCGLENCVADFTCGPHARYCFLIHYIVKGKGYFIANNIRYELKQGDLFTIYPGDLTYYATYPEDPWSFCWFGFGGKKVVELLLGCGITKNTPVMNLSDEDALYELVQNCVKAIPESGEPIKPALQGYLYLIFSRMQDCHLKAEKTGIKKALFTEHVEKALLIIEYSFFKAATVQDIADYVGLERTYFSKIFRITTGMSPQEYLITYRMEKAAHLIETTRLSFKQIGASVGIPNEYYFSRLFKKTKGVSPKKFREAP